MFPVPQQVRARDVAREQPLQKSQPLVNFLQRSHRGDILPHNILERGALLLFTPWRAGGQQRNKNIWRVLHGTHWAGQCCNPTWAHVCLNLFKNISRACLNFLCQASIDPQMLANWNAFRTMLGRFRNLCRSDATTPTQLRPRRIEQGM